MSFIREWDTTFPSDNRRMNNFTDDIRNTRVDIGERYVDNGAIFGITSLVPTVPSGFSVVADVEDAYTEDAVNRNAFQYVNDTPTTHTLASKKCPMFFDSAGNVIFGYDIGGTAYYAKEFSLTMPIGTTILSQAHGIAGSISTNNKIYCVTVYTEDGDDKGFDLIFPTGDYTYKRCYVDDTDISLERGSSAAEYTFTVMIIYKA